MKIAIPKTGNLRPGRNTLVMFLSIALACAGVFYSQRYIEGQIEHYRQQLDTTEAMTKLVVPKRRMERGELLVREDLSVREIPTRFADSNSVAANTYESALGQRLSYAVDEGRPLLWAHLEGGVTPTFSGKVPAGLRAISVRVDEINSLSGFLQPRDKIDLLLTYSKQGQNQVFPLIQNLDIIATGAQTLVDKSGRSEHRAFTTITVKVTPDEAKKITLSQQVGKLTAMLRNPADEAPLDMRSLSLAQLLTIKDTAAPARRITSNPIPTTPGDGIEYIIGGT